MIGEQEIHLYFKYKTSAVIEKFPHAWCKTDTSVLVSFRPKWNRASEAGVSKDFRFTYTMTIATAMTIHIYDDRVKFTITMKKDFHQVELLDGGVNGEPLWKHKLWMNPVHPSQKESTLTLPLASNMDVFYLIDSYYVWWVDPASLYSSMYEYQWIFSSTTVHQLSLFLFQLPFVVSFLRTRSSKLAQYC